MEFYVRKYLAVFRKKGHKNKLSGESADLLSNKRVIFIVAQQLDLHLLKLTFLKVPRLHGGSGVLHI